MTEQSKSGTSLGGEVVAEVWDIGDLALKLRLLEAINSRTATYPIYREFHFAARAQLDILFDSFADISGWTAQRLNSRTVFLESGKALTIARGSQKQSYCSCYFSIWGRSLEVVENAKAQFFDAAEGNRILEPMFSINWHFLTAKNELESVTVEEFANDRLFDSAYPHLDLPVNQFISEYLNAEEAVLVLQGPPGTGKTRFIRAILGELSRSNGGNASVLYTGDKRALENDEVFVRFITGWERAFVVEDADHILRPRAEGNEHLHRFLTIADGVVQSQGRKIIFSTNLPNIRDVDDALIRPGRCFARVNARHLNVEESQKLVSDLSEDRKETMVTAMTFLQRTGKSEFSLAEIYKAVKSVA